MNEDKMVAEEKKDEQIMAKLEIILYKDGNARASGPLANKALCKGMLAMAAQIVDDWRPMIVGINKMPSMGNNGNPFPKQSCNI